MAERNKLQDIASELEILIKRKERNEDKCRPYLEYIKRDLVKGVPMGNLRTIQDYIGTTGKIDFIVIGRMQDGGDGTVQAFIWELKAPQVYIYKKDTHNRLKPSKELIDAENQLLHYCYECKNDGVLKERNMIIDKNDVKLGGIIIGCNKTRVEHHKNFNESIKNDLFFTARKCRDLMYEGKIIFWTWDDVLNNLKTKIVLNEKRKIDEALSTPLPKLTPDDKIHYEKYKKNMG